MELTIQEKKKITNYFNALIEQLCEFDQLDDFFYNDRGYEHWQEIRFYGDGDEYFCSTCGPVHMYNGATRLVIVPEDFPYVAKINFSTGYSEEEFNYDYNDEELMTYNYVLDNYPDVIDVFPTTTAINIHGLKLVVQEKVETDEDMVYSSYPSLCEDSSNSSIIDLLAEIYGDDFYNVVDECYVNDVHDGNIGLKNGKLVLFDFAGYNN